jgi:hypothetical protein
MSYYFTGKNTEAEVREKMKDIVAVALKGLKNGM